MANRVAMGLEDLKKKRFGYKGRAKKKITSIFDDGPPEKAPEAPRDLGPKNIDLLTRKTPMPKFENLGPTPQPTGGPQLPKQDYSNRDTYLGLSESKIIPENAPQAKGGGKMAAFGNIMSSLLPMMQNMGGKQQQQPQQQRPIQQIKMNPIRPVEMTPALGGGILNKDIDLEQLLVMLLAGSGGGQSRGRNLRMRGI